eukprot:m.296805 g.296805  ORF g.296805 m.296805 type:complete len:750 (-) comp16393_c8_seq6:1506-3755(-)
MATHDADDEFETKNFLQTYLEVTGINDFRRIFPIVKWLPKYSKSQAIGDIVAGLTVGLMVLPQGLAYSSIAGLPPVYGLYSAFMGVLVYTFMGTSKDITLGPTALMSLIIGHTYSHLPRPPIVNGTQIENLCSEADTRFCCLDDEDYLCTPVDKAIATTIIAGVLQVIMGLLNFGFVINFIGFPALNGFTTAAAVTIVTSQVKYIFGLNNIRSEWYYTVADIFSSLDETRWQDFLMGISCMALTFYLEKLKAKYNDCRDESKTNYILWLAGTARNALVVGLALIVARIVAVEEGDHVFHLVRDIPDGLPTPESPFKPGLEYGEIINGAVAVSLLGYLESIAIGKVFAQKNGYVIDPTQELRALGVANIIGAFFQSYPVTGSFSRTAVNSASDARTPMCGIVTGTIVIISLVALTPAFYYIPKPALGAIIIMSVVHMIDIAALRKIKNTKPRDMIVWLTSFLLCLLWSLEYGILTAVLVSFILEVGATTFQSLKRLTKSEDEKFLMNENFQIAGLPTRWGPSYVRNVKDDVVVTKPLGSITFSMCNIFNERLVTICTYLRSETVMHACVLDLTASPDLDFTGVDTLRQVLDQAKPAVRKTVNEKTGQAQNLNTMGVVFYAIALPWMRKLIEKSSLTEGSIENGDWPLYLANTIEEAILEFNERKSTIIERFPYPWMKPKTRPSSVPVGTTETGRDGNVWKIVSNGGVKSNKWCRNNDAPKIAVETPYRLNGHNGHYKEDEEKPGSINSYV